MAAAGGGALNGSGFCAALIALEGRNVPLASGPAAGSIVAAASSSVMLMPDAAVVPPMSEKKTNLFPLGATTIMSMSYGKVCESPVSVKVTLLMLPERPETVMLDG
jgi:hypothetical protein